jgi:carotenoid cleavage dioxygenase-like enzyme
MTTTTSFLDGNFAPVTEEVTTHDLPVTGTIPPELEGRLLRIGPNPMSPPDPATHHWFAGDGMVHGVRLRGGRAEWYRNRWVRSDEGTVNTHVIGIAGRTFALVEAGTQPVELTDELDTVGTCAFDGTLDGSFSAHTHPHPVTGDLHAVTYHWSWDHIRHVVVGPDARVRREEKVPVDGGPMVHDCAVTERHVVLFDLPVTFSMDAAASGARLPYRWNPEHPPRVGLLPLGDGSGGPAGVRWLEAPSCFVFHTLNAYDDGDRVVVDVVRHPRMFATRFDGPVEGAPVLERWTLDPAAGAVKTELLDDRPQEFPRIDDRVAGRRHRYGYAVGVPEADGLVDYGPVLKLDLATGEAWAHDYGTGRLSQEPVFVPRPDGGGSADTEDAGWVMSYVHDATTDRADVVILDAQDIAGPPVATIHLPVRVPFGFHGSWLADG